MALFWNSARPGLTHPLPSTRMDTSKIVIGQVLLLLLRIFSVAITTIATCFILLLLLLLLLQGAFALLVELLVLRVYLRFAVL